MRIARLLPIAAIGLVACDSEPSKPQRDRAPASSSAARHTVPPAALTVTPSSQASRETDEPSEAGHGQKLEDEWLLGKRRVVLDEFVDVAPAGPSAAMRLGVLLLLKDGRMALSPLETARSALRRPLRTPLASLDLAPTDLVALEHGPAVSSRFAYFVRQGNLVRQRLPEGVVEILADDARSYTRVALAPATSAETPDIVGYIARHPTEKDTLVARLWIDGKGNYPLTPEGSAGNSVALARTRQGLIAVSLESRTGMSPVHARPISFENGELRLGPDVVPWVAGTAQSLTEIHALGHEDDFWALLPVERDITHFGLARVDVGTPPHFAATVHWRNYPNGLNPAVTATGRLCGEPVVLYARPASADAHSPQELHLARVTAEGLGPSKVVASGRVFVDASIAELDEAALVVYVADRRTRARRLRCLPR